MKKILAVVSLFLFSDLAAQVASRPTQFNRFINKPSVEWAACLNVQATFDKEPLNRILAERLARNEIKASLPLYSGLNDATAITYLTRDSIDNVMLYPSSMLPRYDSAGNELPFDRQSLKSKVTVDSLIQTSLTEILYIENSELKTYVPWVSPMMPIRTSSGILLGQGSYFSTCFNFKYNYKTSRRKKIGFLGETNQLIPLDSAMPLNHIKQLYSRNLVQTIWPYILDGKIKVYTTGSGDLLEKEKIDEYLVNKTKIPVPTYDEAGNITGNSFLASAFETRLFTSVELRQEWYYNYTDNIVFSRIREIVLCLRMIPSEGAEPVSSPVLKIVFN